MSGNYVTLSQTRSGLSTATSEICDHHMGMSTPAGESQASSHSVSTDV